LSQIILSAANILVALALVYYAYQSSTATLRYARITAISLLITQLDLVVRKQSHDLDGKRAEVSTILILKEFPDLKEPYNELIPELLKQKLSAVKK